jgi:FixJ family two-component response regulator
MATVAVIDDDRDFLHQAKIFLIAAGHKPLLYTRGEKAIDDLPNHPVELVITDILMPGLTGGSVCEMLRSEYGKNFPIIVCSGSRLKIRLGNDKRIRQIPKPVDFMHILDVIQDMIEASEPRSQPGNAKTAE